MSNLIKGIVVSFMFFTSCQKHINTSKKGRDRTLILSGIMYNQLNNKVIANEIFRINGTNIKTDSLGHYRFTEVIKRYCENDLNKIEKGKKLVEIIYPLTNQHKQIRVSVNKANTYKNKNFHW